MSCSPPVQVSPSCGSPRSSAARRVASRRSRRSVPLSSIASLREELVERFDDRLEAGGGDRHEAAVRQGAVDRLVAELAERLRGHLLGRPMEEIEQHRQQGHALAVDLDADIDLEPVDAAVVDLDAPAIARAHDPVGIAGIERDPPALGGEARQVAVIELDPMQADVVLLVLLEGEVLAGGLRREAAEAGRAQGLQPELVDPLDELHLGDRVARHDHQAVVDHVVDLAAAVLPADLEARIVEGHLGERQVDLLLLALPAEAAAHGDARAVQMEDRDGLDLDALAALQRFGQGDQVADRLQPLTDQRRGRGRHGRRPQQHRRDPIGHVGPDRAAGVPLEVDVPGRPERQDDDVVLAVLQLADDVLLTVGIEPPAEAAPARLPVGERHAPAVAPVTATRLEHAPQGLGVGRPAQAPALAAAVDEQPADDLILEAEEARRLLAHQGADGQRLLASVGAALELAGADRGHGDGLRHARVPPGALAGLEKVEHAFAAIGGTVHHDRLGGTRQAADPALQLAVDGRGRLVGVGSGRALQDADQRGRGMLALGVDEAGAGAAQPHPPAAPVRDLDPGQEGRPSLAAHPAGDRSAVALDLDVDHGTRRRELLAPSPGRHGEQALEISSIER